MFRTTPSPSQRLQSSTDDLRPELDHRGLGPSATKEESVFFCRAGAETPPIEGKRSKFMNPNRIERILDSGYKAVLVTTGGGSSALNALLTTPGASRFVADAQIPYSPEALERFLGEKPEQSVSPAAARKLADVAFANSPPSEGCPTSRAVAVRRRKGGVGSRRIGIACSAALQTNRERRGADRAFICIKTKQAEKLYALHFSKTSREEQEALLSDWLLVLIAQAVGAERSLMLPGSFNPLHRGHCNLLAVAEEITGLRGVFELSSANVDKPDIPEEEILRRASAIKDIPVALTSAPRFTQKAELFPNTTFVLGIDTAARLIDYAKPDEWKLFQGLETSFLVAGRVFQTLEKDTALAPRPVRRSLGEGGSAETRRTRFQGLETVGAGDDRAHRARLQTFQGLENLEVPTGFESLFEEIPESRFREDISSTDLRG